MRTYLLFASQLYAFSILRPLQKAILARGDEVAWFLLGPWQRYIKSDERLLETVRAVKQFNPAAVFVAGNIVPDFFPGVKVEVFHGFNARKRKKTIGHYRIRGFFDLYCTQGPDTTHHFQELAQDQRFFEVVETGWPKMDPLFNAHPLVKKNNRTVVLFASTFTPRLSAAKPLWEVIRQLSATGRWQWIVNLHPKMDRSVVAQYAAIQSEHLTLAETDDTIPLLRTADVIVSDTSSIIDEFCLQQKPAVTFRHRLPRPHLVNITDPADLVPAIEKALTRPQPLMAAIRDYTDHIHPYRDGRSSYRVLAAADQLIEKGTGHLTGKPFNLIRRLKIRKEMGYYHWY